MLMYVLKLRFSSGFHCVLSYRFALYISEHLKMLKKEQTQNHTHDQTLTRIYKPILKFPLLKKIK